MLENKIVEQGAVGTIKVNKVRIDGKIKMTKKKDKNTFSPFCT